MESLSCGVPVGALEGGGIPEIIADGETGVLAEKLNVGELANKMLNFVNDANLTKEIIRENCKKFAENHYSNAVIAKEYLKIYCK